MKLLAFSKYSYEGPSSRYRFYNYQECFAKQDIEMEIEPLFTKAYFTTMGKMGKLFIVFVLYLKRLLLVSRILINKNKYDLVLLEYELFPYFPAFFEYLFHKRKIKYIVDYDDALFHKYDKHSSWFVRKILKMKIARVMQNAQSVIVCNPYLETYAKKYNENVFTIPTVVLLNKYIETMKTYLEKEDKRFVIGWIGSLTTSVYVLEIMPVIQKFVAKYDNVRFHLIGFDKKLLSREEREKCHIDVIDWKEEFEIEAILDFDIGIMPLKNDAWSRGKCGFKLVQYMACKKPVIASSVGVNCMLVEEGVNGYLVKDTEEWFGAFEKMYLKDEIRQKMSMNNFNKIEKEYNHAIYCQYYVTLLQSG